MLTLKQRLQIHGASHVFLLGRVLILGICLHLILQDLVQARPTLLAELDLDRLVKGVIGGKAQEAEEQRALLEDDAERGKVQAQADLGYLLYKEGKFADARKWWQLAANQGDTDSQISLGTVFEEEGNIAQAKELYQKAREQGDFRGSNNLALLFEKEGKIDEAIELFREAAEQGNVHGQYNLGRMFEKQGKEALAKAWFRKAAQQDHIPAKQKLSVFADLF